MSVQYMFCEGLNFLPPHENLDVWLLDTFGFIEI